MSKLGYVSSGLTALVNNAQAGAYAISSNASTSIFTTCTAGANSCILPANIESGTQLTIILATGVANALNIFPPVGGQINALGLNTALSINAGSSISLVADGSLQYRTIVNQSVGTGYSIKPITAFATPLTIDATQSGRVIQIANAGGVRAITLPAVATSAGINCLIVCSGAVTNANRVVITAPANTLQGHIVDGAGLLAVAGSTSVQLGNVTGAMSVGDQISFVCDGTSWFISATVVAKANLTVA